MALEQSPDPVEELELPPLKPPRIRDDNGLKLKLIWCPPGKFKMGSPDSELGRHPDENQVDVTLKDGFWLGQTEVTQGQWRQLMLTTPWTGERFVKDGDSYPVTYVSYDDAMSFCERLTKQERSAGRLPVDAIYILPTEAQWEYACRAGTSTRFS